MKLILLAIAPPTTFGNTKPGELWLNGHSSMPTPEHRGLKVGDELGERSSYGRAYETTEPGKYRIFGCGAQDPLASDYRVYPVLVAKVNEVE